MMNSVEPVDVGVRIPPEILHLRLNERQKVVLTAIVQLYRGKRECYASNGYFERWLGILAKEISETIGVLVKKKLVERKLVYIGKQIDKRYLIPNLRRLKIIKRRIVVSPNRGEGIPKKG